MPDPKLRIDEDIPFQRKVWKFQRIVWGAMLLVVVAGFFGAFGGGGPLNQTTVRTRTIIVDYERFPAKAAASQVRIVAKPSPSPSLWLSNSYLEQMHLEKILPEPRSAENVDGGILFHFERAEGETVIQLTLRPLKAGSARTRFHVGEAGAVEIKQFVYP